MKKIAIINVNQLAKEFSAGLVRRLDHKDIAEVIQRNRLESDSGICHTHDFCDANVIMGAAFQKVVGREIDPRSDSDADLWSAAWSIAVKAEFWVK